MRLRREAIVRRATVLTMREESAWLRSHERHFSSEGDRLIPPQYWIHDYDSKREQILDAYRTRNAGVRRYFAGRPDDLLVLDICRGEGWEPLCAFLGLEPPGRGFPSLNASR
jgi:hypothetical protein